jgi:glutamate synthase (NADPH/NADH) small chain
MHPSLFEVSSSHEEGGERTYLASTVEFVAGDDGRVCALRVAETEFVNGRRLPKPGSEHDIPAELVLLALGFSGTDSIGLEEQLGVSLNDGLVERDGDYQTSVPGVFVTGDAGRGASLIVWAIAEGRSTAAAVDRYLEGATHLPAPVRPTDRPIAY